MKKFLKEMPIAKIAAGIALLLSATYVNASVLPSDRLNYMHETWSGPYFGLSFGSGSGDADTSLQQINNAVITTQESGDPTTIINFVTAGSGSLSDHITGSLADLFVGYNFHLNPGSPYLFGLQLEGTFFSDIVFSPRGNLTLNGSASTTNPSILSATHSYDFYTDQLSSMFSFLGRIGWLATPNALIYFVGGGAEGHFVLPDSSASINFLQGNDGAIFTNFFTLTNNNFERSLWQLGYVVGAGLEYRVNDNWSLRGEYRFNHFKIDRSGKSSNNTFNAQTGEGQQINVLTRTTADTDFDFNMGKIAIVYRFSPPFMGK